MGKCEPTAISFSCCGNKIPCVNRKIAKKGVQEVHTRLGARLDRSGLHAALSTHTLSHRLETSSS